MFYSGFACFGVGVSYGARESDLHCNPPLNPPTYPFWSCISFAMLYSN